MKSDDSPLSRWSRLKRAARAGEVPGTQRPDAAAGPGEDGAAAPDEPAAATDTRTDAELLEELGLPDPDSIGPGDDVKGFMAQAVPARLRNRALRALWRSNPVLANVDGLVDYGEDFTDAARVVEALATAWQVGRGYAREGVSAEEAAEAADEATAAEIPDAPEAATAEDIHDTLPATSPGTALGEPDARAEQSDEPARPSAATAFAPLPEAVTSPPTAEPGPRRRRMAFRTGGV